MTKSPLTILIVDDVPANVGVLFDFLTAQGFEVLVARNGESALLIIESEKPDLILLDVMMPGLNGFEVCEILKTNPNSHEIPIIFMTALTDTVDKLKGFQLGAVDYVTKPFQQEEVLARINTHLTIRQLQQQLKAQNAALISKNADLNMFTRAVAHDLKNPLNGIIGLAEILLRFDAENLTAKQFEFIQNINESGQKMVEIVNALLLLEHASEQDTQQPQPLEMDDIIVQVKQRLVNMTQQYQAEIIFPTRFPPVQASHAQWIEEVWMNYLTNGIKYGGRPPRLTVGFTPIVQQSHQLTMIRFWVRDNGQGIDQENQAKLFTPFTRINNTHQEAQEGHGLGLSIVQRLVEKMGGTVGVESQIGQGSVFFFTLPAVL